MLEPSEALASGPQAAGEATGSWQFPPARILVVDDGEENRELLQVVLEEVGLQVEGAENGQVGVDKVRSGHFDLVLMDMQMPVMDGYTATALLRKEGFDEPILALTANAMKGFEEQCLQAGCSGYLTKPVNIDLLIETLAEPLGGKRRAGAKEPAERSESTPLQPSPTGEKPQDAGPVTSRLASTPRFLPTVEKFVARLQENLAAMDSCLERRDGEQLVGLAHWLKGSAGTVGFDAFFEPARSLEALARESKWTEIDDSLQQLWVLAERIDLPDRTAGS
jgi:CheY-like chemotaxis protein